MTSWSNWLTHGRFSGHSADSRRSAQRHLQHFRDGVLANANVRHGDRVLDVGAGTGLLSIGAAALVGLTGQVIAVDISPDALARIPRRADHVPIHRIGGDVTKLPLHDATVDVVVVRSVLIYVPDKPQAVREMVRVLRPGGRLSVFEPINAERGHNVDLTGFDLVPGRSTVMADISAESLPRLLRGGGLETDVVHREVVTEQLRTIDEVDGFLRRPPNPTSRAPLTEVEERHGKRTAQAFRSRWVRALDAGVIEFTTPVLYVGAHKPT